MKRLLYLSALLLMFSCRQETKQDYELLPVEVENRWGYIDHKGEYVINPQYQTAYFFSDNVARIKDNAKNQFGFIDKTGKAIIEPKYLTATDFKDGIAVVSEEDKKISLINKQGEIIVTLDSISTCREFYEDMAAVEIKGKWGYINSSGKLVIEPNYLSCGNFSDGLSFVKIDSSETLYAYINSMGETVIPPKYSNVGEFHNGLAKFEQNDLWGYLDKTGNVKINPQFDWATDFIGNYSAVKLGEKWGYIDQTGKYKINPQFDWAGNFSNELAVIKSGEKYGYINLKGEFIINPQFDEAIEFYDEIAFISQDGKYGLINKKGKITVNPQFFNSGKWSFNSVYIWGDNIAKSDYFDSKSIINELLKNISNKAFFGATNETTAKELKDNDNTLYERSNYLYNYGFKLNENASITNLSYYFNNDFVSYKKQYKTKKSYGYSFKEYVGQKKIVNYETKINKIEVTIKINDKDKVEKFIEKLKESIKNEFKIEGEYLTINSSTSISIYSNYSDNINLTIYFK